MRGAMGSWGAICALNLVLTVAACPGSSIVAPETPTPREQDGARGEPAGAKSMEDTVTESMTCVVAVEVAGLPHRGEVMLEKDRGAVSGAAHTLAGTSDRGEVRTTPAFNTGDLMGALVSDEAMRRRAAAVLLGRCRVGNEALMRSLGELLDQRLELETDPSVRAELAMSRSLLGDSKGVAVPILETLAAGDPTGRGSCAAAAYLAQHGKTSGWPAILLAFDQAQPTWVRVDAVMAASAFGPLQGSTTPGGARVDVAGFLAGALDDKEVGVRQAAIAALVEIEHPEAIALLASVETRDPSPGVRAVASHWLWHLRRAAPPTP